MKTTKDIFFLYHKNHKNRLVAFYADNVVLYTAKQFLTLHGVILTINGEDYRIDKDFCTKL